MDNQQSSEKYEGMGHPGGAGDHRCPVLCQNVAFLIRVPTGSMIPTIDEKSWLVATRIHNPEKRVERGTSSPF